MNPSVSSGYPIALNKDGEDVFTFLRKVDG